jgi:hypothetical protein
MRKTQLLFLDDIRLPIDCLDFIKSSKIDTQIYLNDTWAIVRSYDEFIAWIETHGLPELISFDHDLGLSQDSNLEEKNGLTCVKWLVNYCMDNDLIIPEYIVHSQNPVGKVNIQGYLEGFLKTTKMSSTI